MTITTIFNPGDTVWTLSKNQIVETKIVELYGHLDGGGEIRQGSDRVTAIHAGKGGVVDTTEH